MSKERQDMPTKPATHPVDVGVVVVNYHNDRSATNAAQQFVRLFNEAGYTAQAIICDNSETIIDRDDERYSVLRLPNPGYAAAMNAGVSRIDARFYLLCSHEVEWIDGGVEALIHAASGENVAACGPKLINSVTGSVLSAGKDMVRGTPINITDQSRHHPYTVDSLDGACWLVTRDAWSDVGELDERLFLYWEETDWCSRARSAGCNILCVPEVTVSASASTEPSAVYYLYRNRYYFVADHVSVLRAWSIALSEILIRIPGAVMRKLLVPSSSQPHARLRVRALKDWLLHKTGPVDLG